MNEQRGRASTNRVLRSTVWLCLLAIGACGHSGSPAALHSITISPAARSLAAGLSYQFTTTGHYSDGTTAPLTSGLTWSSSSGAVATVDATGLVTSLANGSATITCAHTASGLQGAAALTVTPAVIASVTVAPDFYAPPTIGVGQGLSFVATGDYSDGTRTKLSSVVWSTSNSTALTIDGTGLAIAASAGTATITGTDPGTQLSGTAQFTVTDVVSLPLSSLPYQSANFGTGYVYYAITGLTVGQFYTVSVSGLTSNAPGTSLVTNTYQDPGFSTLFCCAQTAFAVGQPHSCTGQSTTGTLYVAIWGSPSASASQFTLDMGAPVVTAFARPGPQGGTLSPTSATHLLYQVTGLTTGTSYLVTLSGLTDNVNLVVYGDPLLASPICSASYSGSSTSDCTAVASGSSLFVDVSGFWILAPVNFTITVAP